MYRFHLEETFPAAPREVLDRSMVDFSEYEKFMPNISRIQVLSRGVKPDGREHISVQVFADMQLPAIARPFFKKSDLTWKEFYVVDHEKLTADWQGETPVFTDYVDCKGTSWIEPADSGARMVVKGTMTIDHRGWTGFGGDLARKVIAVLEPFIGKMVTKNLQTYFRNIKQCMEQENRERAR